MPSLEETKKGLDSISPTLCLAKWNQVTIHLGTGLTHSCHHPSPHKISEVEVAHDPRALHCTMHKKKCWREMLEGKRPKECDYCWKIEDNSPLHSDRIFKSSEPWAWPTLDKVGNSDWLENYNPTYVEISFSNRCNNKCLYCSPPFSSRWQAEAKQYGPIYFSDGSSLDEPLDEKIEKRCNNIAENPLTQAFWKWWPELFKNLHTFRITGGEPLLTEECFTLLRYIQEHWEDNPNLALGINTNLGMSDEKFEEFVEISKDLFNNGKVREYVLFTSIESAERQAEYVRYGLDAPKLWSRIDRLLTELPKLTLTIMATYNVLSVSTFDDVILRSLAMKTKHRNDVREYGTPLMLDTSYIRWPSMLSPKLATGKLREKIKASGDLIKSLQRKKFIDRYGNEHSWMPGFCETEVEKVERIYDYVQNDKEPFDHAAMKGKLIELLTEADRRRETNYKEIFPEIETL